jgi:hypothetical protein
MEHNKPHFFASPLWYFILAVLCSLMLVFSTKITVITYSRSPNIHLAIDLRWLFWIALTLTFFTAFQLLRMIGRTLHDRGQLPLVFRGFFEDNFKKKFEHVKERVRFILGSCPGRLALAGLGIFVVVALLWQTQAIHDDETSTHCFRLVDTFKGRSEVQREPAAVELLSFFTGDSGNYYEKRIQLVQDLKKAGVKAVLMRFQGLEGLGQSSPFIRELEKSDIVVYASDYSFSFRGRDGLGEFLITLASQTLDEKTLDETGDLVRVRPADAASPEVPYDITLELLRKYSGYPSNLRAIWAGGRLEFGKYKLPITSEGWSYSRNTDKWPGGGGVLVYVDKSGLVKYSDPGGAKFFLAGITSPGLKLILNWSRRAEDVTNQLQGKIVILAEHYPGYSYLIPYVYGATVENIVNDVLITKSGSAHLWLSVACLLVAGLLAYRYRWTIAVPSMFILGILTLLLGSYLYDNLNYLIDIFYPLLSTAVAMVTFPVIAMKPRD